MANPEEERYSLEEILAEFRQPAGTNPRQEKAGQTGQPASKPAAKPPQEPERPAPAKAPPSQEKKPPAAEPPTAPRREKPRLSDQELAAAIDKIQREKAAAGRPLNAGPRQSTVKFPAVKEMPQPRKPAKAEAPEGKKPAEAGQPRPAPLRFAPGTKPARPANVPPVQRTLSTQPPKKAAPAEAPVQSPPKRKKEDWEDRFDPEEPEPPKKPKKRLAYDLINRPSDDGVQAAARLGRRLKSMAARMLILLPVVGAALYLTLAAEGHLPFPEVLDYQSRPEYLLYGLAGCQLMALLLCWESTKSGLWRLFRGRPTLDTVVTVSGLVNLAYCVAAALRPQLRMGLPYVCVSGTTAFFALLAKRQRYAALRRNYKTLTSGAAPAGVKRYSDGKIQGLAVKTQSGVDVAAEELSRPDFTEGFSCWYSPIVMVLALALSVSVTAAQGETFRLLWTVSALLSVGAPMCLLLSSSASATRLGKKLYTSGSMLVNASAASDLARSRYAALRDADLYPAGAVKITGMKIADNQDPETVVGFAASLLQEVGGGLGKAFSEFARQMYVAPARAKELRFFETRGIAATVGGRYIQLGTADYLIRTGVRVSEGLKLKNSVFVAIDTQFAGIFSMRYEVQSPAYAAFGLLKFSRIRPVLALRDTNLTQQAVEEQFELKRDTVYLPDLEERLRYSASSFGSGEETLALLSRDGMMPFAEVLAASKKWRRAAVQGCVMGTLCALSGMVLLAFLAREGTWELASPLNVLAYLLLWSLPSKLLRGLMTRL